MFDDNIYTMCYKCPLYILSEKSCVVPQGFLFQPPWTAELSPRRMSPFLSSLGSMSKSPSVGWPLLLSIIFTRPPLVLRSDHYFNLIKYMIKHVWKAYWKSLFEGRGRVGPLYWWNSWSTVSRSIILHQTHLFDIWNFHWFLGRED